MQEQVKDAYIWCAISKDRVAFDEEGAEHGFASVASEQVEFVLLFPRDEEQRRVQRVRIPDGATPVFFRRRSVAFHPDESTTTGATVHCIGWKRGDDGVYLFVGDDGSTLLTSDMQAV